MGNQQRILLERECILPMKTAAEYRAMAEECYKWAREAQANEVRMSLKQLAQVWLDAASKLDGLPAIRLAAMPDDSPKTVA
jgi:hypothetical protein